MELKDSQIVEASRVLGRAFQDDPLAVHMFPDPNQRAKRLPLHFEALVRYGRVAEKVWSIHDLDGIVVCQRPGHSEMNAESMEKSGLTRLLAMIGEEPVNRFNQALAYLEPFRRRDAQADHWYVMVIGVDPSKQGKGVGSALLGHVLRVADRDQVPCYLETAQAANVPFYVKNGFRVLVESEEPISGIRFWTFRREST